VNVQLRFQRCSAGVSNHTQLNAFVRMK